MNSTGEAADQVVRMYLNGVEVAAKLTGQASKQIAVLLYAVLKEQNKTKGKARLTSILRSGKELKVFAVKDADLETFCKAAKDYGVLYCVLKNKAAKDGVTDVMVRAEDASKINRIFERFQLATVDRASLKSEIIQSREAAKTDKNPTEKKQEASTPSPEDALIDSLLGTERVREENPTKGAAPLPPKKENPSVPTSEPARETVVPDPYGKRPSVRKEIRKMQQARAQQLTQVGVPALEQTPLSAYRHPKSNYRERSDK